MLNYCDCDFGSGDTYQLRTAVSTISDLFRFKLKFEQKKKKKKQELE